MRTGPTPTVTLPGDAVPSAWLPGGGAAGTPAAAEDRTRAFEQALRAHDAAVIARGLEIWIGNEPTFTDGRSHATEWLSGALGADKLRRARHLVARLARESPGCAVLRSLGRQYPGESLPRWSFGVYADRDGLAVWDGPPDPLLAVEDGPREPPDAGALLHALGGALGRRGFVARAFFHAAEARLIFARHDGRPLPELFSDARLARASIHTGAVPESGLVDTLASDGLFLVIGQTEREGERGEEDGEGGSGVVPCLELPAVDDVGAFRELLAAIAESARACAASTLVLRGYPPPVDARTSLTTVTPDPAVVEVNMAPHAGVEAFLRDNRRVFAAAADTGLGPFRLYYNGVVVDSGGGGQMTIGGPSPARSPFFVEPRLLPRLVRHVVRHPALSYLFAHAHVGPSGQSVRPDERGGDALAELGLELAWLAHDVPREPLGLWRSLGPFLTDGGGNSHRADLNIEKLWNPTLPGRGCLGLVEMRGLGMQQTPERAAALAALWRAVIARLMVGREPGALVDWGPSLHDRFALPFYLDADLREVLEDLAEVGLGLGPEIVSELVSDPERVWRTVELEGCRLTVRRGLEFWPLVGDASGQQGTSRLVDASTSRIELTLRGEGHPSWRVRAGGVDLPLREERDGRGPVRVFGLRYRSFVPAEGLHPALAPALPLRLLLVDGEAGGAWELALHEWRSDGRDYPGLPRDLAEAQERRAARCLVRRLDAGEVPPPLGAAPGALTPFSLDLRYPPAPPAR